MTKAKDTARVIRDGKRAKQLKLALGRTSAIYGPKQASQLFKVSYSMAKYWKRKIIDPNWRISALGGRRRGFSEETEQAIIAVIKNSITSCPTMSCPLIRNQIYTQLGLEVSTTYIKSVLAAADWTCVADIISARNSFSDRSIARVDGKFLKLSR